LKDLQIENKGKRRTVSDDLKIYGSAEDLTELRDAITKALNCGLIQGWIGVGALDDPESVFPYNGKDKVPTESWPVEDF